MSEPMTTAPVGDVLSSIRRLVSEQGAAPAPSSAPEAEPARLLLTPALRVIETPMAEDPLPEENTGAMSEVLARLDLAMRAVSSEPASLPDSQIQTWQAVEKPAPLLLVKPVAIPLEAEVTEKIVETVKEEIPRSTAELFNADLRDLVRELIREELAGSLGERMTQNIRKLVRAEVARAMSLRDLD